MTSAPPRDLESLRVLLWWERVLAASGLAEPDEIEWAVRELDPELPYERTGNLRKYPKGGRPYRLGKGPQLIKAIWPERIQKRWPGHGTWSWLATPFWYLMSHRPDSAGLVECIQVLPEELREELLEPGTAPGQQRELGYLIKLVVYELALHVSPMRLGALACAMRRARLASQPDLERLSMVASAWMLMEMLDRVPVRQQSLVEHLVHYFLLQSAEYVYGVGYSAPLEIRDLERFDKALKEHANWTVETELQRLGVAATA